MNIYEKYVTLRREVSGLRAAFFMLSIELQREREQRMKCEQAIEEMQENYDTQLFHLYRRINNKE